MGFSQACTTILLHLQQLNRQHSFIQLICGYMNECIQLDLVMHNYRTGLFVAITSYVFYLNIVKKFYYCLDISDDKLSVFCEPNWVICNYQLSSAWTLNVLLLLLFLLLFLLLIFTAVKLVFGWYLARTPNLRYPTLFSVPLFFLIEQINVLCLPPYIL